MQQQTHHLEDDWVNSFKNYMISIEPKSVINRDVKEKYSKFHVHNFIDISYNQLDSLFGIYGNFLNSTKTFSLFEQHLDAQHEFVMTCPPEGQETISTYF